MEKNLITEPYFLVIFRTRVTREKEFDYRIFLLLNNLIIEFSLEKKTCVIQHIWRRLMLQICLVVVANIMQTEKDKFSTK